MLGYITKTKPELWLEGGPQNMADAIESRAAKLLMARLRGNIAEAKPAKIAEALNRKTDDFFVEE